MTQRSVKCIRYSIKLILECQDSDGLTGFYYSHDGYWTEGSTFKGSKTKMECVNTCTQNCVAINTYATSSNGDCYHYSNRTVLISANERQWDGSKAYIKCLGNNEPGHSFKLCDLQLRLYISIYNQHFLSDP